MAKVICVNNNKGGSLKTTTTVNLAGVLAKEGKKVLIIDADNQSNVSLSFGLNPDKFRAGLYQVLMGELSPQNVIVNVYNTVYSSIDILPSNSDLIGFDFEVIGNTSLRRKFSLMKSTCDQLRDSYDYILIDTPPSLSLMVGNAFTFADEVLIPYTPETYSMRSLVKVIETIEDFKQSHNPDLKLMGIVATMVNYRTNLHTDIMKESRQYASKNGLRFFDTFIPHSIRFASSIAYDNIPATLSEETKSKERAEVFFELWKEINEDE